MNSSVKLHGTYLAKGSAEVLSMTIDADSYEYPFVSVELSNCGTIATWKANQLVSDMALMRMAATARDVEDWAPLSLPFKSLEWADGVPTSISFWIDCGECEFSVLKRGRVDFTLRVFDELPTTYQYTIRCPKKEIAEWGKKLNDLLLKCNITM